MYTLVGRFKPMNARVAIGLFLSRESAISYRDQAPDLTSFAVVEFISTDEDGK